MITAIFQDHRGQTIERTLDVAAAAGQLRQTFETTQRERRAFMAAQPPTVICPAHPDCPRPLDEELTQRATAGHGGEFTAGYLPCTQCLAEAQRDRFRSYGAPENLLAARFENFRPDVAASAGHVNGSVHDFVIFTGVFEARSDHSPPESRIQEPFTVSLAMLRRWQGMARSRLQAAEPELYKQEFRNIQSLPGANC